MSVAKVIEITASSKKSFEDAIAHGIQKASKTVHGIKSGWISEQKVIVANDKVSEWRVTLRLSFLVED